MATDLCVDVYVKKTSPYTQKTSPYTQKTSPYTQICVAPLADVNFEFMDGTSVLFMDSVNFQFYEA